MTRPHNSFGLTAASDQWFSSQQWKPICVLLLKLHLVDLLRIYCTACCTTNPQQVETSTANPQQIKSCTTNPQHLDMARCCGFVVGATTNPQHLNILTWQDVVDCCGRYNKSTISWHLDMARCQDVVDLLWVLQQIHNKLNQHGWRFRLVVDLF